MNVSKQDVFIFWDGEATEKAVNKMARALGKKDEAKQAVKFARAMLDIAGRREAIEEEGQRKRLSFLFAYYRVHAVKNILLKAIDSTSEIANKIYEQYRLNGGDYIEEEAYRTGKTIEEVREKRMNENSTRCGKKAPEAIAKAEAEQKPATE